MEENPASGKPLILVDGSSYLYRAFHALPPLSASDGHPTGAIKGVIAMIKKLMNEYPGSPMVIVLDAAKRSFRNDLYEDYKANRPPMPDDLRPQVQAVKDIIEALGIPLLVVEDVEADDVIGTLARRASNAGRDVLISTTDKDLAQLVDGHVRWMNTMSDKLLDRDGVIQEFGVPPERIVDYLALMGDSVDNIPGVPKVGKKTAAKWLAEYGSLDEIMSRAEEFKGKVGENLRASLDHLPLSRELATIRCDVDLPIDLDEIEMRPADVERLRELYARFEFVSWLDELTRGEDPPAAEEEAVDYRVIGDQAGLNALIETLSDHEEVAFEVVTAGHDYMESELVGLAFAWTPGEGAYLPLGHDYAGAPAQLGRQPVLAELRPWLEDGSRSKVGYDLKYAISVLARYEIDLAGCDFDVMLESYVVDSVATKHNLEELTAKYLGRSKRRYEDIAGKGAKQLSFNAVDLEAASPFAAEDTDMALRLHRVLYPKLSADTGLLHVFESIEMPLVPVLSRMERTGTLVDGRRLEQQSAELEARLRELHQRAIELAGEEFNLDSTKQLQAILYDKLGLPVLRKTPGGKPSTAEPVLSELALDYELPRVIMDYRQLAKLKSTYTDKLPLQINPRTGRIHTSYRQAIAATGRLSSSDPNLQNIPVRTEEGRRIRQAFIAPPGHRLVALDYSQIELRIMAHLSGDAGLARAFAEGMDVHRATAAEVFGCRPEEVSDDQRRNAKAINFGLIYGMSAFGLARQLGVSRKVAQDYIARYFERYPGVERYMHETRERAREQGYVETLFGRRLYLPEIRTRNAARRQAAERTAINAPMQGSAADIIKRAMIDVDAWLSSAEASARMIMQVHDELVLEVPIAEVEMVIERVRALMTGAAELSVPLVVDAGVGDNWDEAH